MMKVNELQSALNKLRGARSPGMVPIPVTGRMDGRTSDALRAFQHEHNDFNGARVLVENGELNVATQTALDWWIAVLHQISIRGGK